MATGSFHALPISDRVVTWAYYGEHGCPNCATGNQEVWTWVQGPGFALVECTQCKVAYEINDKKATLDVEQETP